ncbi:quinone oxidoreductase family protein [Alkalicoccus urumqiensis]|uniref:Enoyl reductase (ER) domain-containing protein n=1 Tax=Alkalicoccus urumqiensis TaxID=1548213 RepID=A0A2P6MJR5_ALKUR|nr:NADP-dependent oxidoreductase [Alkalicoccus urumqiensis]PRO66514.1 hypothetical protein C6I21_04005 [Alkalicoccus urumqiensis]
MKAVEMNAFGSPDVLHLSERETPSPGPDDVLIQNAASSVTFGDVYARRFHKVTPATFTMPLPLLLPAKLMMGWRKPKVSILGSTFSGIVHSTGSNVTRFSPGDEVFGYTGQQFGGYAEFICLKETGVLAKKPQRLSFAEAASLPYGFLMAYSLLKKAKLRRGESVLIIGASGSIGSAMVQLAGEEFGAEVSGVARHEGTAFVRSLGAADAYDSDVHVSGEWGAGYDLIVDIPNVLPFFMAKPLLTSNGRMMKVSFTGRQVIESLKTLRRRPRLLTRLASESAGSLEKIASMAEAGTIAPRIDRVFPLDGAADAHTYVESTAHQGAVILEIQDLAGTAVPPVSGPPSVTDRANSPDA